MIVDTAIAHTLVVDIIVDMVSWLLAYGKSNIMSNVIKVWWRVDNNNCDFFPFLSTRVELPEKKYSYTKKQNMNIRFV